MDVWKTLLDMIPNATISNSLRVTQKMKKKEKEK